MYVAVNKKNEIKQVGVSTDPSLTSLYIRDEVSPFKGWSAAKICCYKVHVKDGYVMMMTPYVDSRWLDHIDQLGLETEANAEMIDETNVGLMEAYEATIANSEQIDETNVGLMETYEATATNSEQIDALELALEEVYEMIMEG